MDLEKYKDRLTEYVRMITAPSKVKDFYVCPLCASGTGKNHKDGKGDGAFKVYEDENRWYCYSCCEGGDIYDLIGKMEHCDTLSEQYKKAVEIFADDILEDVLKNPPRPVAIYTEWQKSKNSTTKSTKTDYTNYFKQCQKSLINTDYHIRRGISTETAQKMGIGFDGSFWASNNRGRWKALVIPTSKTSYAVRNTDLNADKGDRYDKKGTQPPYNLKAFKTANKPIFIVEGHLDALSIIEVGGQAVALGGKGYNKLLNYLEVNPPKQLLVIALDNDPEGQTASDNLDKALTDMGIKHVVYNPYLGEKDANDALLSDRQAFTENIKKADDLRDTKTQSVETDREKYLATSAKTYIQSFIDGIHENASTPPIRTNFSQLDETLEGGLFEGLYVLGAISSLGKTTHALQMMDQIAQRGQDVLIFTLEMSRFELIAKSISRTTAEYCIDHNLDLSLARSNRGITNGSLWSGYDDRQKQVIYSAINIYESYSDHVFIQEGMGNIGVEQVRKTIEKHITYTGNKPVVLIDYLQILAPNDTRATDKQNTDKAVTELKRISRDFKIPVIAISSFNRANYNNQVGMEAFKESGAIEYSSDVLLGMQFKRISQDGFDVNEEKQGKGQYGRRDVEVVILKNRNGRTGDKLEFEYYPIFNLFLNKK